jgi:hypothetical protein
VRGLALAVLCAAACDYQPRPPSQGAHGTAAVAAAPAAGERRLDNGDCAMTLAIDGMT